MAGMRLVDAFFKWMGAPPDYPSAFSPRVMNAIASAGMTAHQYERYDTAGEFTGHACPFCSHELRKLMKSSPAQAPGGLVTMKNAAVGFVCTNCGAASRRREDWVDIEEFLVAGRTGDDGIGATP